MRENGECGGGEVDGTNPRIDFFNNLGDEARVVLQADIDRGLTHFPVHYTGFDDPTRRFDKPAMAKCATLRWLFWNGECRPLALCGKSRPHLLGSAMGCKAEVQTCVRSHR